MQIIQSYCSAHIFFTQAATREQSEVTLTLREQTECDWLWDHSILETAV